MPEDLAPKSAILETESVQGAIRAIMSHLLARSAVSARPRGIDTREILGGAIKISNPRNRLVVRPSSQKWSLPYAMAEFLWYMRGENSLATMSYYSPRISQYSDDGKTLNSAYGYRIFGHHNQIHFNQWQAVQSKLVADPDSRQAVIHIRMPGDSSLQTKDHPCTIALQFLLRSNLLHLIVMMRSNDVMLGTPYDIFSFTMMQEQMAFELGVEVGHYYHQVGSWHLYETDRQIAEQMIEEDLTVLPMPPLQTGLQHVIEDEVEIRCGQNVPLGEGYWRDWRLVLSAYSGRTVKAEQLNDAYRSVWINGIRYRSNKATARPGG